jgi:hypothetical protein
MSNKLFCGRGKRFGQYGSISLSICLDDLPSEYITTGNNGKRYIKINVNEKREADEWGNTHSVEVDTWKADNRPAQQPIARPASNLRPLSEDADIDELGF